MSQCDWCTGNIHRLDRITAFNKEFCCRSCLVLYAKVWEKKDVVYYSSEIDRLIEISQWKRLRYGD